MAGTAATEAAVLLCGLTTGVLAARLLQPAGRGAVAAAIFWPQVIAVVGSLSVNDATAHRLSAQPQRAGAIQAAALWVSVLLAFGATAIGYVLLPTLLGAARQDLVPSARYYLLIFVPCHVVSLVLLSFDHGKLRFARYNILRIAVPASYLAALSLLALTGRASVASVLAANCGATAAMLIIRALWQIEALSIKTSIAETMTLLRLALRFHLVAMLMLGFYADQFVVLALWDNATLGYYAVALTVASSGLGIIGNALPRVLLPHLPQLPDRRDQVELLASAVRQSTVLTVGLSALVAINIPWIIPVLFGRSFESAIAPALALLIPCQIMTVTTILVYGLRSLGSTRASSSVAGISIAIFLLLAWPLGRGFGLIGIALALLVGNVASLTYAVAYLRRHHHLSPRALWGLKPETVRELITSIAVQYERLRHAGTPVQPLTQRSQSQLI